MSGINSNEVFNDGNKYQVSKVNTFRKKNLGSRQRFDRSRGGNNNFYTTTRVVQDGVLPTGEIHYKREVIMFDSKSKLDDYNNLSDEERLTNGNTGNGIIIAEGSTLAGEKSFKLTEAGANSDFLKDGNGKLDQKKIDSIQKASAGQVKDIVKDEKNSKVKQSLEGFSNNRKANSKDDEIDSKAAEDAAEKKQKALDKRLARGKYPDMFYPIHIRDSLQDKLKITILKPKDENSSASKRKRFASKKTGNQLLPNDYKNLDASKYPKLAAAFNNKQGKYVGYGLRNSFARSQDKIYAAGENIDQPEFDKTPIGHIFLPIPDGVTDQNKVNFGSGTLNPLQKITSGAALQFLRGKTKKEESTGAVLKRAVKDQNTRRAITNLIAGSATGVNTDELLARTEGSILNNNLALLFKGPALRTFTFQFLLSPRDRSEALQVRQIIRALKQSSAVQRTRGGIFLGAPNTYELKFMSGLQPHGFLPRIKHCALLSVGVNYMPENTYMTYEDTSMVSYSLSLSFQELESIYNDDYDSDNETPVDKLEDGIFETDFAGQAKSRGIGF